MDHKVHVELRSSEHWPIAAAMLPFAPVQGEGGERWLSDLSEVASEGFADVDLTDTWLRIGDLSASQRGDLADVLRASGLRAIAASAIRRSVLDPDRGAANLEYSHRTIDAAAELGCEVVSVGLHRPLTPAQREAFWFWTAPGPVDDQGSATWSLAVSLLRELGRHAQEVGLRLSLEMYEDTLLGSSGSAVRLVTEIGLDCVGLNPDLANLYRLHRETEPFLEAVSACMPLANYWHVKSYYRDVDPRTGVHVAIPAPMASGSMDYRSAIKSAVAAGFGGPFCVEHYGGDGLTVMAENRDYIRRMLSVALRSVTSGAPAQAAHGAPAQVLT